MDLGTLVQNGVHAQIQEMISVLSVNIVVAIVISCIYDVLSPPYPPPLPALKYHLTCSVIFESNDADSNVVVLVFMLLFFFLINRSAKGYNEELSSACKLDSTAKVY